MLEKDRHPNPNNIFKPINNKQVYQESKHLPIIYSTEVKSKFSEIEMKKKFSYKIFGDKKTGNYMNPLKKSSQSELNNQTSKTKDVDLTNSRIANISINDSKVKKKTDDLISQDPKMFEKKKENTKDKDKDKVKKEIKNENAISTKTSLNSKETKVKTANTKFSTIDKSENTKKKK